MSDHVRVSVKFEIDVTPPGDESAAHYAERCLIAYFNSSNINTEQHIQPQPRIQPHGENWYMIKAVQR